jgi:single-strand DNA-binding protein
MITATIVGRLGADPETRTTRSGDSVTSANVASTTKIGGEERTTWVRVSIWGRRGDAFAQYHAKGAQCALTGSLTVREYDHNGERRKSVELDVRDWAFVGSKQDRQGGGGHDGGDIPFAPVEVL